MNTITLESVQNELIREILNTDNIHVLEKLKEMLHREGKKSNTVTTSLVSEKAKPYMTKAEILAGLAEACEDMKLAREGKLEGRPIEELLNEL